MLSSMQNDIRTLPHLLFLSSASTALERAIKRGNELTEAQIDPRRLQYSLRGLAYESLLYAFSDVDES